MHRLQDVSVVGLAQLIVNRKNEQWTQLEEVSDHGFNIDVLIDMEDANLITVKRLSNNPMIKLTAQGIKAITRYVRG